MKTNRKGGRGNEAHYDYGNCAEEALSISELRFEKRIGKSGHTKNVSLFSYM